MTILKSGVESRRRSGVQLDTLPAAPAAKFGAKSIAQPSFGDREGNSDDRATHDIHKTSSGLRSREWQNNTGGSSH